MITIFDGNFILHRILRIPEFYSMTYNGMPTGGVYGCLQTLHNSFLYNPPARKKIIVWDGKKSLRRKAIFDDYKSNRKPKTEEEKQQFNEYMTNFNLQRKILQEKFLPALGVLSITFADKEGDDVIYQILNLYKDEEMLLISEDKDMLQLLTCFEKLKVYQPIKKLLIDRSNFKEHMEIPYQTYLIYKSIIGDKSDNIPNIPKVGEVTAKKLVNLIDLNSNDLTANFLEIVKSFKAEATAKNKKFKESFVYDHWGIFARNLELVDMTREEFLNSEIANLKSAVDSFNAGVYKDALIDSYCQMGFFSLLERIDSFLHPFYK